MSFTRITRIIAATMVAIITLGLATVPASAATAVRVTNAGDLIITGSNATDQVTIESNPAGFRVRVHTGSGDIVHEIGDDIRDIVVNLRGGRDSLIVETRGSGFDAPRDLRISLGSGRNATLIDGVRVERNLRISDGSDDTDIHVIGSQVIGRTTIALGGGHHEIESRWNAFTAGYTMSTSSTGSLDLEVEQDSYQSTYRLTTGNRIDDVRFEDSTAFRGTATVDLRDGDDVFDSTSGTNYIGRLTMRLGAGADRARFSVNGFQNRYNINAGSGDDLVSIFGNSFNAAGTMNGSSGVDRLTGEANQFQRPPTITGFEQQD